MEAGKWKHGLTTCGSLVLTHVVLGPGLNHPEKDQKEQTTPNNPHLSNLFGQILATQSSSNKN